MPSPNTHSGSDGKKLVRRLVTSFAACGDASRQYGQCISQHFDGVQQGACEKEFRALNECFRKEISKARARGA